MANEGSFVTFVDPFELPLLPSFAMEKNESWDGFEGIETKF